MSYSHSASHPVRLVESWEPHYNLIQDDFLGGVMRTPLQPDSRRLYSWWWDSHISPKNFKMASRKSYRYLFHLRKENIKQIEVISEHGSSETLHESSKGQEEGRKIERPKKIRGMGA